MKILVISHCSLATYQNMGKTLISLFGEFSPYRLCQLYIRPMEPDTKMCSAYYNVTDADVIESYIKFGRVSHKEYYPGDISGRSYVEPISRKENRYRSQKRSYSRLFARNAAWLFARWFNADLKSWIEKEEPTHIFLAPGDSMFIYWMAQKISKKYKIPVVGYFCDDYYFNREYRSSIERLYKFFLRRTIRKSISKMAQIVTICEPMTKKYEEFFGVRATTIMTGSNYEIAKGARISEHPHRLVYMGGLGINRDVSLIKIAEALHEINCRYNSNFSLEIYSGSSTDKVDQACQSLPELEYKGFVTGVDFREKMLSADFLVHVESFDEKDIERVRYSVSTKIADSLGSGIPLVAYGSPSVASISHLLSNKCAYVLSREKIDIEGLYLFLKDAPRQGRNAEAGLRAAKKNHDAKAGSLILREILDNLE